MVYTKRIRKVVNKLEKFTRGTLIIKDLLGNCRNVGIIPIFYEPEIFFVYCLLIDRNRTECEKRWKIPFLLGVGVRLTLRFDLGRLCAIKICVLFARSPGLTRLGRILLEESQFRLSEHKMINEA